MGEHRRTRGAACSCGRTRLRGTAAAMVPGQRESDSSEVGGPDGVTRDVGEVACRGEGQHDGVNRGQSQPPQRGDSAPGCRSWLRTRSSGYRLACACVGVGVGVGVARPYPTDVLRACRRSVRGSRCRRRRRSARTGTDPALVRATGDLMLVVKLRPPVHNPRQAKRSVFGMMADRA